MLECLPFYIICPHNRPLLHTFNQVKRTRIESTVRYEFRNQSHVIRRTTFFGQCQN